MHCHTDEFRYQSGLLGLREIKRICFPVGRILPNYHEIIQIGRIPPTSTPLLIISQQEQVTIEQQYLFTVVIDTSG